MNAVVGKIFKNQHLSKPRKGNQTQSPRAAAGLFINQLICQTKITQQKPSQIFCPTHRNTIWNPSEQAKTHPAYVFPYKQKSERGIEKLVLKRLLLSSIANEHVLRCHHGKGFQMISIVQLQKKNKTFDEQHINRQLKISYRCAR